MAISFHNMAFGYVALTAVVLFAHGRPSQVPQQPRETAARTAAPSAPARAAAGPFRSVSVELPVSDRVFPDGHGAELANASCLACHSVAMVLNQPPLSVAAWTEIVNKMRHSYHAPMEDGDVAAIAAYLAGLQN